VKGAPEAATLTVRSAVPGRIRWQIDALQHNRALAEELEQLLGDDDRLEEVVINTETGRLLVVYDPILEPAGLPAEIAARVLLTVEAHEATGRGRRRPRRGFAELLAAYWPELRFILIGTPIAALALTTANPILVLTAVGAIAASGVVFVKSFKQEGRGSLLKLDAQSGETARLFLTELNVHRTALIVAGLSTVTAVGFGISRTVLIGNAIDAVLPASGGGLSGIRTNAGRFLRSGGLMIAGTVVAGVLNVVSARLIRRVAIDIEDRLRLRLYAHIQHAEMQYVESADSSELHTLLTTDVANVQSLLGVADDMLQLLATIVIAAVNFMLVSPETAWISMLGIPVTLLAVAWLQKRQIPRYQQLREKTANLYRSMVTDPQAIATMKAFGTEDRQLQLIAQRSVEYEEASHRANRLAAAAGPIVELSVMTGIAGTVAAGGLLAGSKVTAGQYSSMVMMSRQLLTPFAGMGRMFDTFQKSWVGLQRLFAVGDSIPIEERGTLPLPREKVKGNIRYRDVHFQYQAGMEVLHGVSLNIKAGKTTAIVGPTGSGKSTLLRLLIAFIRAQRGSIEIDKQPLAETRVEDLRRAFAFVSQEVYLFAGTVRENINLSRPNASEEETRRAAAIAAADDFIERLPLGYDSPVGERGVRLSGGERQRIAIARAIASDAPILVLDEATSHLDNETEHRVYENLNRELKKRTKIIVAHRLAAASMADWIYVLEDGKLAEEGTHQQLVEEGGLYASLWRLQTEEQTFE
jgi:ATP-binding cassette subfamily B protein